MMAAPPGGRRNCRFAFVGRHRGVCRRRHVRSLGRRRFRRGNVPRDDRRWADLDVFSRTEPVDFVDRRHRSLVHRGDVLCGRRLGPLWPVGHDRGLRDRRWRRDVDRVEPPVGLRTERPAVLLVRDVRVDRLPSPGGTRRHRRARSCTAPTVDRRGRVRPCRPGWGRSARCRPRTPCVALPAPSVATGRKAPCSPRPTVPGRGPGRAPPGFRTHW